jgi:hypothetical protein
VVALASATSRLLRAYSVQVETLRRLRHGGDQYVRVEHVHFSDGGQAVIDNVRTREECKTVQAKHASSKDGEDGCRQGEEARNSDPSKKIEQEHTRRRHTREIGRAICYRLVEG